MGRISSTIIVSAVVSILFISTAEASTLSVETDIDVSGISLSQSEEDAVKLLAPGMLRTNFLGYPAVPYKVVNVLLPQGEEVLAFRLEGGRTIELFDSVTLSPFEGNYLEEGVIAGQKVKEDEVVGDDSSFPAWKVRHTGTSSWRGYRIASFEIYPVHYEISSGRLTADIGTMLIVETGAAFETRETVAKRVRHVDGFREKSRIGVRSRVVNPDLESSYTFDDIDIDDGDRGFEPSYLPGLEGSEVSYLIITNAEMESEFQRLADWKTQKGIPAIVRTTEWIEQNYREGADLAETIRNFIRDAYEKWGVEYVLLGGDTDIIPARYGYVTFYSSDEIPTDMYYSCLDGSWNADGDSLWGEAFHSTLDWGDEVDLYAELYIGRFPVVDAAAAEILVDKSMNYEVPVDTLHNGEFLFLAEVIFPPDYVPGDNIVLDGADLLESIYNLYLLGHPDISTTRLYENYSEFPGSSILTVDSALDSMDSGPSHVLHAGHGGKYNLSAGNGSLVNYNAFNLENGDETFSMYLMNCDNLAFDTDCLAEYFLLNPNGGAFAVTGSSRSAFPSASRPYMDEYYRLMFDEDIVKLGNLYTLSREPYTGGASGETADRWTHFIYNFLGDPELSIFRGSPDTFTVSSPTAVAFGSNNITIQVSSGGSPFDSALVCLYKDGDDYEYGYTDVSGEITFDGFLCREGGSITMTVTGIDHCRYTGTIDVTTETGAYTRITSKLIDDRLSGNGDWIIDAGESAYLDVELMNTGTTTAEKLWAEISPLDTAVTVIDSIVIFPDINPTNMAFGLTQFTFSVDTLVGDETPVEFLMEIHDSTGGYWSETFALEIHAPELELYINTVSDEVPYGNGNGTIENGENFLLNIGIKNFGTGAAYGLEGKIRTTDGTIAITDSTSGYPDLDHLELGYGEGFVLSESDLSVDNLLTFEITDQYGRIFSKEIELREPGASHWVHLDASLAPDEIHVTWHPPDSTESYRYLVYNSLTPGGPYELISDDLVFHTLFRDRGLEPKTPYYYVVVTVDSCGNISEQSIEVGISTNPPQLMGWPNSVGKGSSSSPKVADVDGDKHPDVVVGAEYVYVWDGNGIELRDGDGQPLTWGILNMEGDDYTATCALGDLDGVEGAEIVGASWNTKEIYVFTHDGSTLPGWPKSTTDLCWASPVIGDFDGDTDSEVIAYDIDGTVYIWHHDGTELMDGDSNPSTDGVFFAAGSPADGWHVSTPALADMDGDGVMELIVCAPADSIYCLNADQSAVTGWPVHVGNAGANIGASPAVGDIDNDTYPEVVVQNDAGWVQGLNHDGTMMSGWPVWVNSNNFFCGSPALADFTGDGQLEVVVPSMNGYLYMIRANGSNMPGFPTPYAPNGPTESSPIIVDIDDDGSLDIIMGCEEGYLNAWDMYANFIPGFPIRLRNFIRGTPVVRDLDFDGDLELIASCWDQNVYIWDLDARRHSGYAPWNGFHGNQFNSGWYDCPTLTDAAVTAWMFEMGSGFLTLSWSIPDATTEWDLYRRTGGGDYTIMARELRSNSAGVLEFIDRTIEEGLSYTYKLEVSGGGAAVETDAIEVPVTRARLNQNHPNPFNPSTVISFTVPGGSTSRNEVSLMIFDVRGALVKTLVRGGVTGGRHEVTWNGTNDRGVQVASGIYFARFVTGGYKEMRKLVLLR
jgi:hypothetical protein